MKYLVTSILVALVGGCASIDPHSLIYVGYMKRDCGAVKNDDRLVAVPLGFKLSPVEAAKALPSGCDSKFFYGVYADEKHYYFVNNNKLLFRSFDAELLKSYSYIVSPIDGKLISDPVNVKN
jgi:hypothetical protein